MSRPFRTLALVATISLLSAPSFAYVSIESDELGPPAQGSSGVLSGAIDGRDGASDYSDLSAGGRLNYQAGVTTMFVTGEYDNAKTDNHRIEETSWAHAGFQDEFQRGLAAEAFADYLKDNFRALDNRSQVGAGARFTLDYGPQERGVYAGVGLLHEWLDQANTSSDYWRLNSYVAYKRQLNDQTRVLFNAYFQPRLGHGSDYLASGEAAVLVKLATNLDFKVGVRYQYGSESAPGIDPNDTRYTTSVNYRF